MLWGIYSTHVPCQVFDCTLEACYATIPRSSSIVLTWPIEPCIHVVAWLSPTRKEHDVQCVCACGEHLQYYNFHCSEYVNLISDDESGTHAHSPSPPPFSPLTPVDKWAYISIFKLLYTCRQQGWGGSENHETSVQYDLHYSVFPSASSANQRNNITSPT